MQEIAGNLGGETVRIKNLIPHLSLVKQFDIVDIKTGEVYYCKSFLAHKNYVGKKILRMKVVDLIIEDDKRLTIWVKWYR